MLLIGAKSMVVAAGLLSTMTIWPGRTVRGAGAAPIVHWSKAPVVTKSGIGPTYRLLYQLARQAHRRLR
jgi:hypothetical protein